FSLHDDPSGVGSFQAQHVPQGDRLARSRSAQDDHDLAPEHGDVGPAQDLLRAVGFVNLLQLDKRLARRAPPFRGRSRLGASVGRWSVGHQNANRNSLVRKKSMIKTVMALMTTVTVVDRPTPSAPPEVRNPL